MKVFDYMRGNFFYSYAANLFGPYKLLLFFGSPRTGSTLLGQILNFHPNCLVATEFRLLNKVIIDGISYSKALAEMRATAFRQFKNGIEADVKFGKTLGRYQERWKSFYGLSGDPEFKKKKIKILGDKKAGGATKVFMDYPDKTVDFLEKHRNLILLQILRHPIDAAISYMNSHKIGAFAAACEDVISKSHIAYELCQKMRAPNYVLYYEDLIREPKAEIEKLMNWLVVKHSSTWLEVITERVNNINNSQHYTEDFVSVATHLIQKYQAGEEFGRYF